MAQRIPWLVLAATLAAPHARACPSFAIEPAIPAQPELIATFVNRAGDIAGVSSADRAQSQAFLFRNGQVRFINAPNGATHAVPTDINGAGHVVGEAYVVANVAHATSLTNWRAFIYRDGITVDLDVPNAHALGVNDRRTAQRVRFFIATG